MSDIERFYGLLHNLAARCGGPRRLRDCHGRMEWPERGVYFFFEEGELRPNGAQRVARVGTHAVSTGSRTTLWKRLSQHRGSVGGRRPGGGNHRASVFRLHVGRSLINRDGDPDGISATWGQSSSQPDAQIRHAEYANERRVTELIGNMPLLWLEVDDAAGTSSDRALIEAGTIALLSRIAHRSAESASPAWLGRYSDRPAVRESGLWNVNHTGGPALDFLDRMEYWTRRQGL